MRNIPGWAIGAVGVGALVGAFYLGGRAGATAAPPATVTNGELAASAAAAPELAVECEPGQRAVVRAVAGASPSVACVSDARPVSAATEFADTRYAPMLRVADRDNRPYARPAVLTEPTEVYRPRSRPVSYDSREVGAPKRSVKKSVAIIAGSTAAGAVMGGLVKGKKGAIIGGIVGGGAATVWDQVTRRQNDIR